MAIQSLEQFRTTFSAVAIQIEIPSVREFCDALEKDNVFTDAEKRLGAEEMFGKEPIAVMERIAKEGKSIYLKPLLSHERDRFEASVVGIDGKRELANLRARLVSECWQFSDGKRVGDAKYVGNLPATWIGLIFDKVREVNGMDKDAVEEAGKE